MSDSTRPRKIKIKIEVEYECPHCKTIVTGHYGEVRGSSGEDYVAVDRAWAACGKWVEVKL